MEKNKSAFLTFSKIIRVLTVAPLLALISLSVLYFAKISGFESLPVYLMSILFLVVLPLLAYPVQPLIPKFKEQGRSGQRNLAIICAVIGYIACIVYGFAAGVERNVWILYLTYFISGLGIMLFNKVFKIKASGHACGVAGPIAFMVYFMGPFALFALILAIFVFVSSIKTKRHTFSQLIIGSLISVFAFFIALPVSNMLIW